MTEQLKVLDLFSGIGGFTLGLEKNPLFKTQMFCEIEPHCIKVLNKNYPDIPINTDIKQLNIDEGEYDVMCGGFPCQDISIAGKNAGITGARSGLWFEYHRLIKQGRPKYVIIENVSALLSRGLSTVLQNLAEIGYDATWTTYDTQFFGLPHRRRRVYIVGVRDGIPSESDIFQFAGRDTAQSGYKMEIVKQGFEWHFAEKTTGRDVAYYTRQRSDQFAECGVCSTLMKRDYKDFTDVILEDGYIRKVTPTERMRLQGIPEDWYDNCGLTVQQQYSVPGMSVPVVHHIADLLADFHVNRDKHEQ